MTSFERLAESNGEYTTRWWFRAIAAELEKREGTFHDFDTVEEIVAWLRAECSPDPQVPGVEPE